MRLMGIDVASKFVLAILVISLMIFAPSVFHQNQSDAYLSPSSLNILSIEMAPQPPTRVGTYWLNFSFDDKNGAPFANIGFEFYVDENQTGPWDGFASTPIALQQKEVNYIEFANISALFMLDIFKNGSLFSSGRNYAGPPNYGPPGYNYGLYGLGCGFPCIKGDSYFEQNGTGYDNSLYKAWIYWFTASNLIVVPVSSQVENQTLQDLNIVVNMTVSMVGNNASEWTFQPNIQINGAKYSVSAADGSSLYVIQTGIQLSASPWNALTIGVVTSVALLAGVSSFFVLKRFRKAKASG